MSDPSDLLDRATRALRESGEATSKHESGASRLAFALARRKRSNGRKRAMVVVLLAASFPLAAWAANSETVRRVIQATVERVVHLGETRPKVVSGHVVDPIAPPSAVPAAPPSPVAPVPTETAIAVDTPRATTKPSAIKAIDADDLYRTAHAAHFEGHDPDAALRAWDRYLAAAPQGEFALEARYNRALTLVRLGRVREAKDALEPFARGDYGGYRRAEASALILRFESKPAP